MTDFFWSLIVKKLISIKDFIIAVNYNIADGYEYLWDCYGSNASGLNWEKPDLSASACLIYDIKTHKAYEMSVWDCADNLNPNVYRWLNPEYLNAHKRECRSRGFKFNVAIDNIKYNDVNPTYLLDKLKKLYGRKIKNKSFIG